MQWKILTVHLRAGYDVIGFRQVRTFGELYKLARIDASSTESTVAECAEERSSKGRLRSNLAAENRRSRFEGSRRPCEAARKGPRPRVKIESLDCQIQVIGAGVGMHRRAKLGGNPRQDTESVPTHRQICLRLSLSLVH